MKKIILLILTVLAFFQTPMLWRYSSPNIPIDDPVYRDVDKLVAAGLVRDVIYGQRPWNRDEIARIIGVALKKQEQMGPVLVPDDREISFRLQMNAVLERLQKRFHEELVQREVIEGNPKTFSLHPLSYVEAQYTFLDGEKRRIPNNGLGLVDASIEPLTAYQEGRHFPEGHQFALETEHRLLATRFFSFYARPRFQADIRDDRSAPLHGGFAFHRRPATGVSATACGWNYLPIFKPPHFTDHHSMAHEHPDLPRWHPVRVPHR